MTVWHRLLIIVVGLEIAAGGWFAARQLMTAAVPRPNLERLDAKTIADLESLQQKRDTWGTPAWKDLAQAYLGYGCFPESELCFRQALAAEPNSSQTAIGRGFALSRLGQIELSNAQLAEGLPHAGEDQQSHIWYHIGRNHLRQENAEEAASAFIKAKKSPPAYYQLARLELRANHPAEAIPWIKKLDEADSFSIEAAQLKMLAAQALGNEPAAREARDTIDRSQRELDLNDQVQLLDSFRERFGLARQMVRLRKIAEAGEFAEAAEFLKAIRRSNPTWSHRYWFLPLVGAEFEVKSGHAEDALKYVAEYAAASANSPFSLELQGDALLLLGLGDEARAAWEHAIRLLPNFILYTKLAEYDKSKKRDADAAREQGLASYFAGLHAFRNNQLEEARKSFLEAIKLNAKQPQAQFYLGETERVTGRPQEALKAYAACLELDPNHGRALDAKPRAEADLARMPKLMPRPKPNR